MLRLLRLVEQFHELERTLADDWSELRLQLTVEDESRAARAAELLGPANPGRHGRVLRFGVDRSGPGVGADGARRLLRRLDGQGFDGRLELTATQKAPPAAPSTKETLRGQWSRQIEAAPPDWSDAYAEIHLDSTDYLERAALLLAPVNPSRTCGISTLRFRSAHTFGYGVSAEMAGRCLERCDDEGITGAVDVIHVLSDTQPVGTQGPVWLFGGKTV
jgi:hypothetical protein